MKRATELDVATERLQAYLDAMEAMAAERKDWKSIGVMASAAQTELYIFKERAKQALDDVLHGNGKAADAMRLSAILEEGGGGLHG